MKFKLKLLVVSFLLSAVVAKANNSVVVKSKKNMISRSFLSACVGADEKLMKKVTSGEDMAEKDLFVQKKVLSNGMTVLVREVHNIPKVSMQIFYNVGSKDEKTGEKGIAHLIEHMVFKGTKNLSETDIIAVMHKLSGECNAFTSYDFTGYLFNMPTQHWQEVLPIMQECMTSCSFKDDLLNSEMKAVIQEMKMIKDQYVRYLALDVMLGLSFPDHPYHYPVIGYKQDLWNVHGENLKAFHRKHYLPNNATLVVVGDVNAQQVFDLAQKTFGDIPANPTYKKEKLYFNTDIVSKSATLYRDVKQPLVMFSFIVPGMKEKNEHILDAAELVLGKGKGSRLYRKLVDELKLATSLDADSIRLFDHSVFFIFVEPKDLQDIYEIKEEIVDEIASIVQEGITEQEIERAIKQSQMVYYSKLESVQSQAYDIGKFFLATGDENYPFTYLQDFSGNLSDEIKSFFAQYLRPAVMFKGFIVPLDEGEKKQWKQLQELSDKEDKQILATRVRETLLEKPEYANKVAVKDAVTFDFPKAKTFDLSNGVKVLYHDNKNTPKINLVLELRAKYYYDPEDMQGLYNFVANAMTEGTKKYTAAQLADEIENRGMSLSVSPGSISMSMIREDLPKGLEILEEVLSRPAFNKKEVEKVREQILVDIKNFWDDPSSISGQLIKENIYQGHPYSKNMLGKKETVKKIRRRDLSHFHKKYISPSGAKLAIVGDLSGYDLKKVLEETFAKWKGPEVTEMEFPTVDTTKIGELNHYLNRDQVVVSFANLSIDRKHKDYDKFLLFDQIFGGGVLGAMHSRLFHLREQTGLFYTISGSSVVNAGKQPGLALVRTIVSLDRMQEAEKVIRETIDKTADSLTEQELGLAKCAIANAIKNNFETNKKIAYAFLFLEKYNFPSDYFDNRAQQLAQVALADIKDAVKTVMNASTMVTLRVGRVGKPDTVA